MPSWYVKYSILKNYIKIIMAIIENRRQYFYFYYGSIISEYFELLEMEAELEHMLRERKGKLLYS